MTKYQGAYRDEVYEDDEVDFVDGEDGVEDDGFEEELSPEEATFKQRYSDLRRHLHSKEQEFNRKLSEIQNQLESSVSKEMKLPKTADEIAAWRTKFPDVYDIIRTISIEEVKSERKNIDKELERVNRLERQITAKEAMIHLKKLHPDFDEIRSDPSFHEWAKEQSEWIIDALYHNDTDYQKAADALDLYKARVRRAPSQDDPRGAARQVRRAEGTPRSGNGKPTFRESQIQAMSAKEYDKYEEAIDLAFAEGRVVFDISGGAR